MNEQTQRINIYIYMLVFSLGLRPILDSPVRFSGESKIGLKPRLNANIHIRELFFCPVTNHMRVPEEDL